MLGAVPPDFRNAQSGSEKRGRGRPSEADGLTGEQLSMVGDDKAQPPQELPYQTEPPKRRRGRPSKAGLARHSTGQPALAQKEGGKKGRKLPERLTEQERTHRWYRMSLVFPHPTIFTSKLALEHFPELDYLQNARGSLNSAVKRGLVENLGKGDFRFTASAAAELHDSVGNLSLQSETNSAPASSHRGPISLRKPEMPPSPPKSVSQPQLSSPPPAAHAASAVSAPLSAPDVAPRRSPAPSSTPAARFAPGTMPPSVATSDEDRLGTLLQLSRRYRSGRFYNVDDFVVPLRECRAAVYGDIDVGAGEPPVCVVIDAYEPDPKVVNPNDIDVMFLDVKGQAHIRSAASWQFLPYRKK